MSGLRFTDGVTTITVEDHTLSTPAYNTLSYVPQVPDPKGTEVKDKADGGEVRDVSYDNLDETAQVAYHPGSEAAARITYQGFSKMFETARQRSRTRKGKKVYQEFRYADTDAWWRSEVMYGKAELHDEALGWQQLFGELWMNLQWRRRFFWEGAEQTMTMKLGGVGAAASVVTVQNQLGSGNYPWFTIDATSLDADLPCPIRFELYNSYAGGPSLRRLGDSYLARSAILDLTNAPSILEAEAGTPESTSAVNSSSTASGGQVRSWTWTGTALKSLLYWQLGNSAISALAGGWYRIMGRITSNASNYFVRLRVTVNSLTTIWTSPWSSMNGYTLQDLGTIQLPPAFLAGNLYPVELHIDVRGPSTSTNSFELDYIAICPTEGFRTLRQNGYSAPQGVTLVDDTIEEELYTYGWSGATSAKLPNFVGYGPQMLLIPGLVNRFYLLTSNEIGGSEIDRTTQVRAYVRPRKKAL